VPLTVPRISWDQVGKAGEPGRYKIMSGWLTITVDDLHIWSQFPGATFTLYEAPGGDGNEYRLGSVNLNTAPVAAPRDRQILARGFRGSLPALTGDLP
jgi:hypothetical protein